MFISKRKIQGNFYYYLEDRVNGKRISISLGRKEHAKERLESSFITLINKTMVAQLRLAQKKYKKSLLSISEQLLLEKLNIDYTLLQDFFPEGFIAFKNDEFVRYAQGSVSVEGNSLSLQEAALVLGKDIAIAGKKIEEIREMENMKLAAKVSETLNELTEKNIKKMHFAIMKGFDEKMPGKYREGPMFITASKVRPPAAHAIAKKMKQLFYWLEQNKNILHPIELAGEFHARFEEIHPFNDGNGRVGREILNVMLRLSGYPRTIINLENRGSYITLLERVQLNKKYRNFSKFIYLCLEKRAKEISIILEQNKDAILTNLAKKAGLSKKKSFTKKKTVSKAKSKKPAAKKKSVKKTVDK